MASLIVVFPKLEEAKNIKNLLMRSGYSVAAVCTSGAQAINYADELNSGIVICGYKYTDMIYSELYECLPPHFEMLLVASRHVLSTCVTEDIICLSLPIKLYDLLSTIDMMSQSIERKKRKQKSKPRVRSEEEIEYIKKAKGLLMERNNLTEEEAHRYIQKCSMDSGNNMSETAQMILSLMKI